MKIVKTGTPGIIVLIILNFENWGFIIVGCYRIVSAKDAEEIANTEEPDQIAEE